MNNINIAGTIGRDAEIRYLSNGDPVASFSVADNQGKDKEPIWWRASLFGKRATSLQPYLVKGQQVTISGSVSENSFTDKDGNKRTAMDVRVNDIALQGGRRESAPDPAHKQRKPDPAFDDVSDVPF